VPSSDNRIERLLRRVLSGYISAMTPWVRRLLVVEDEALVASLLSEILRGAGFDVSMCSNAAQARALVEDFDPDVVLIDIHLGPGPSGLHLGHVLRKTHPHLALVFLTKYDEVVLGEAEALTIPQGCAFLAKDKMTDLRYLLDGIESVLTGGGVMESHDLFRTGMLSHLTRTQLEVLRLAACGLTNSAIARQRATSERTVEQRLQAVYRSLHIPLSDEVNPRIEAVRLYILAAGVPERGTGS